MATNKRVASTWTLPEIVLETKYHTCLHNCRRTNATQIASMQNNKLRENVQIKHIQTQQVERRSDPRARRNNAVRCGTCRIVLLKHVSPELSSQQVRQQTRQAPETIRCCYSCRFYVGSTKWRSKHVNSRRDAHWLPEACGFYPADSTLNSKSLNAHVLPGACGF